VRITRAAWETASTRADPDLFGVLADHTRILGQKVPNEPAPVRDVRRVIVEQLRGGSPSLERVAKQLAMSPRTLQRRLREHGLSYADLLDSTRAAAAKRWTGQTPNEYRRHA
jgi:AraC-like DNA-binding protein